MLLQMLDDGRLTDSRGRNVNFKNTIIIMTSNVGARDIQYSSKLGFAVADNEDKDRYEKMKDTVMEEMKKAFRPEFLNRLDDIVVFSHLTKEEIRQIVDVMLDELTKRLENQEMGIEIPNDVKDHLADEGYSQTYGARPLRRLIQKTIEDALAEELLTGLAQEGDTIKLRLEDNKIVFDKVKSKSKKSKKDSKEEKSEDTEPVTDNE